MAVLLQCYLFYPKLYALQFLHTASLVDQDEQEGLATGIQLTYIMIQKPVLEAERC